MSLQLGSVQIGTEEDVVAVRSKARHTAAELGFDVHDQTRIATAVSEIARNAFAYGHGGQAEFSVHSAAGMFTVRISDSGPGIADLKGILNGHYDSHTGTGLGILGARRLMDDFHIESGGAGGTVVTLSKKLPAAARKLTPQRLAAIAGQVSVPDSGGTLAELRHGNRELMRLISELRTREEDLGRLNAELEDTNRGVVALYAELDEKAERLKRADEMKSRFLSHMSHEFRTPLSSIMALSRLLMDEADGTLSGEQHKQVTFIRKSAESLLELVNDLLDLARVEAGKSVVRPTQFQVASLFGALRGVLRPLQVNEAVELIFDDPMNLPPLYTDEGKVAQILRNFISNALKFTERGWVRVTARLSADQKSVVFSVQDTGIGIRPKDLERIFQEFAQVETPIHSRVRGTGLGLPLSRGLAELLGGCVSVESEPGSGSTFTAEIPLQYNAGETEHPQRAETCDVLVIDDDEVSRYVARQAVGPGLVVTEAADGQSGLELARRLRPSVILLDLNMPGMDGFAVLRELKAQDYTRNIPVVVVTSVTLSREDRAFLGAQAAAVFSKEALSRPERTQELRALVHDARGEERSADALPQAGVRP
jgi:signal transduction histidine kinase/CheY-like chemotaxis protein